MALYTSTQDGDWNDPNTWGGGGWPNGAGDTAIIQHDVRYNISSVVQLGDIQIQNNGLLYFEPAMNTKLTLGNANLTIQNGGELQIGTLATPINKNFTAELVWNPTTDAQKGLNNQGGGKLTIYGDPDYYGSDDRSRLVANWNAGQVFTIVGDYTAKWNIGDKVTVHKNGSYGNWILDTLIFTIANIALNGTNTDITIAEAAPGVLFNAGGRVNNVSRNVKIYKLNAIETIGNYNTLRPGIWCQNPVTANNSIISNADVLGIYWINAWHNFRFLDSTIRNGNAGFQGGYNHTISGNIVSVQYGTRNAVSRASISANIYGCRYIDYQAVGCEFSGLLYGTQYGFYHGANNIMSGSAHGHYILFRNPSAFTVSGCVYQNTYAFQSNDGFIVTGKIGFDENDIEKPNTNDFDFYNTNNAMEIICRGVKEPTAGFVYYRRNSTEEWDADVYFENFDETVGDHRRYSMFATILKNTTTLRTGGAATSIEVIPLSLMDSNCIVKIFEWEEADVPASAQTRSIYIKGEGWTVFPTNTELYFEVEYLDQASGGHTTTLASTAVLTDNVTWIEFPIAFTPLQAGIVRYRAYLKTYEAGAKIYIDNALYCSSDNNKYPIWSDGQSKLFSEQLDLPAVGDVEKGVAYYNSRLTGTFEVPAESDVREGIQYGANGTEFTGTFIPTYVLRLRGIMRDKAKMKGYLHSGDE